MYSAEYQMIELQTPKQILLDRVARALGGVALDQTVGPPSVEYPACSARPDSDMT